MYKYYLDSSADGLPVFRRRTDAELRGKAVINGNGCAIAQLENTRAHYQVTFLQTCFDCREIAKPLAKPDKLLTDNLAAGCRGVIRCLFYNKD